MLDRNNLPTEDELSNEELSSLIKEKTLSQCIIEDNEYTKEKIFKYTRSRGYDWNGDIVLYGGKWFYVNISTDTIRVIDRDIQISDPSEYEKHLLSNPNKNIIINRNPSK